MKNIKILVIHGPNLNLLGTRETDIYGQTGINDINKMIMDFGKKDNTDISIFQNNSEGGIIDLIHNSKEYNGIVINPGAYTHTSIAIADAIKAIDIPCVEVHLSNIYSREEYRKISYTAPVCIGQISGFGPYSYILGLIAIADFLKNN